VGHPQRLVRSACPQNSRFHRDVASNEVLEGVLGREGRYEHEHDAPPGGPTRTPMCRYRTVEVMGDTARDLLIGARLVLGQVSY